MPGGEVEGWIAFIVPENRDVMIAYEYTFEPVALLRFKSMKFLKFFRD